MKRAQNVDQVFASHLRDGSVEIVFECGTTRSAFRMSRAEAVTLANGISLQPISDHAPKDLLAAVAKMSLPSVLPLPLLAPPVSTATMTDYPDGVIVEMHMNSRTANGVFRRVQMPMFADTAHTLIEALQEQLERIGQGTPTTAKPQFS